MVGLAGAADPTGPLLPILVFAILVLTPVFAVFVAMSAEWRAVMAGTVVDDGTYVEFHDVAPAFAHAFAAIASPSITTTQ